MKKFTALLLALIMIIPGFSASAKAKETVTVSEGTFDGYDYYYKDSYFYEKASLYNPSLSTMSLILTMAGEARSIYNWTYQYIDIEELLTDLGFSDFDINEDFKYYPTLSSMGVAMAHKEINVEGKTYTLLAVVPRGNYEGEWASNFAMGSSLDANGFSESSDNIEAFAKEYTEKYGANFKGDLKLWIVGYSRGAAIANLFAGRLSSSLTLGAYRLERENIYGYTFETRQP